MTIPSKPITFGLTIDEALHRGARRQHGRAQVTADIEVMEPWLMRGVVLNEGDGGVRAVLPVALFAGDRCLLRIHGWDRPAMVAAARVAWSRQVDGEWLVGFEYVGLEAEAMAPVEVERARRTRRLGSVCAQGILDSN